jgi:hypothetical protein
MTECSDCKHLHSGDGACDDCIYDTTRRDNYEPIEEVPYD